MAINKKLIHFKTKQNFNGEVAKGNILDTSIVFIKDSQEIHTHGTTYKSVNWSVLEEPATPNLITFTVYDGKWYQAENGMTWETFINSNYNDGGIYIYDNFPSYSNHHILVSSSPYVNAKLTDEIINNHAYTRMKSEPLEPM